MLGELALKHYDECHNCSLCLIKAYAEAYNVTVPEQSLKMCSCIKNGFGIGGFCSAITGGFMIFGLHFDEETSLRLRINLLDKFKQKFGDFNCSILTANSTNQLICDELVYYTAELVEQLIKSE